MTLGSWSKNVVILFSLLCLLYGAIFSKISQDVEDVSQNQMFEFNFDL